MRYVGSSTNPHGLMVATMPAMKRERQVHSRSLSMTRVSCASSSWPVWRTMVPSAATNSVNGEGGDADLVMNSPSPS